MRSVGYYSVLQAKMRTSCDVPCEDRGQAVFEHVVYALFFFVCFFLYINPVFVWEECLETSGSLKRLDSPQGNLGTAVKCCRQQLEGRDGFEGLLQVNKHKC